MTQSPGKIIATFPKPHGFTRTNRFLLTFLLLTSAFAAGTNPPYDPLKVSGAEIASLTFETKDSSRDRTLPLRVYLPHSAKPAPIVNPLSPDLRSGPSAVSGAPARSKFLAACG